MRKSDVLLFSPLKGYEYYLSECTKEVLMAIGGVFAVKLPTSLRKNEMSKRLADALLNNPESWLNLIPLYELKVLKKLLELSPKQALLIQREAPLLITAQVKLIMNETVGTNYQYMIHDDVRRSITPCIDSILDNRLQRGDEKVEQLICGLLNIYGRLRIEDLKKRLLAMMEQLQLPTVDIDDYFNHSLLVQLNLMEWENETVDGEMFIETYIVNPVIQDGEWYEENENHDLDRNRYYPIETVLDYGQFPYIQPCGPEAEAFYKYIVHTFKLKEEDAPGVFTNLWIEIQAEITPIESLAAHISGNPFSSINEVDNYMKHYAAFANNIPRWLLRGYSSNDISRRKEEAESFMNSMNSGDMPMNDPFGFGNMSMMRKQGRNEPCQCGSGKKYKNCCGKGN